MKTAPISSAEQRTVRDVLGGMARPIDSIRRASYNLEILTLDDEMQDIHCNAIMFVADSLIALHQQLESALGETLMLMREAKESEGS